MTKLGLSPKSKRKVVKKAPVDSKLEELQSLVENGGVPLLEYREYLENELSAENLHFYLAVETYRTQVVDGNKVQLAWQIFEDFLSPSASKAITIEGDTTKLVKRVEKILNNYKREVVSHDLFDALQERALHAMLDDTWSRFQKNAAARCQGGTKNRATPTRPVSTRTMTFNQVLTQVSEDSTSLKSSKMNRGNSSSSLTKGSFGNSSFSLGGSKHRSPKLAKNVLAEQGAVVQKAGYKRGFLQKRGDSNKRYRRRWFILSDSALAYYEDEFTPVAKGIIDLANVLRVEENPLAMDENQRFCFGVQVPNRLYAIQANNNSDRARWISAIKEAMKSNFDERSFEDGMFGGTSASNASSTYSMMSDRSADRDSFVRQLVSQDDIDRGLGLLNLEPVEEVTFLDEDGNVSELTDMSNI